MKNNKVVIIGVVVIGIVTAVALIAGRKNAPSAPEGNAPAGAKAGEVITGPMPGSVPPTALPFPPGANPNPNTPATAGMALPDGGTFVPTKPPPGNPVLQVMGATPAPIAGSKELTPDGMSSAMEAVLKGLGSCLESARTEPGKVIKAELSFEAWGADGKWAIKKPEVKSLGSENAALKTCIIDQMRSVSSETTAVGAMRFVVPIEYGLPAVVGPAPLVPPPGMPSQGMPSQGMPQGRPGMPPQGMQGMPPPGMQGAPPPGMQGAPAAPPPGAQPQPR